MSAVLPLEEWMIASFWEMLRKLRVTYRFWPDVLQQIEERPDDFGDTPQERIENYILDALFDYHEDDWWERINPAQGEAFWEEAKNEFFLAALQTLEEVIAEPILAMDEKAFRAIQQSFSFRANLQTPVGEYLDAYGEEGAARYEDYAERLHVMAKVWTDLLFACLEERYPRARQATLFGPHYRRGQFRVISSKDKEEEES